MAMLNSQHSKLDEPSLFVRPSGLTGQIAMGTQPLGIEIKKCCSGDPPPVGNRSAVRATGTVDALWIWTRALLPLVAQRTKIGIMAVAVQQVRHAPPT